MKAFAGKVAVVTGAASGIGRALARRCAREGLRVVLADVQERALGEVQAELSDAGAEAIAMRTDISSAEEVEALARRSFVSFGAVHLLFNNAGVGGLGPRTWETSLADWQWMLGVNLWGVIHAVHAFVPRLLAQDTEAHIVNTASMAGLVSGPGLGAYKVAKHGVVTLSETLYHELSAAGAPVKVSVLCPGRVNTNIMDTAFQRPSRREAVPPGADPLTQENEADRAMRSFLASDGMPPDEVADAVFRAIQEERFYIFSHRHRLEDVRRRMDDILLGRNPGKATALTP
jgi:NAD(P)-dependent dehydrogenase (short-subunit alcohol dehydrogenase family)